MNCCKDFTHTRQYACRSLTFCVIFNGPWAFKIDLYFDKIKNTVCNLFMSDT